MESKLAASIFLSAYLCPFGILLGRSLQCLNRLEVNSMSRNLSELQRLIINFKLLGYAFKKSRFVECMIKNVSFSNFDWKCLISDCEFRI